jgi:acetylornithine deacetylase/succinyl-diaminopimelate desuccinylase-like protein
LSYIGHRLPLSDLVGLQAVVAVLGDTDPDKIIDYLRHQLPQRHFPLEAAPVKVPVPVNAVRDAAAAQGYPHQDIVSGAGHDAVYLARVAPSAMGLVPCAGGITQRDRRRQTVDPVRSSDRLQGSLFHSAVCEKA